MANKLKNIRATLLAMVLLLVTGTLRAQKVRDSSVAMPLVSLSYAAQLPFGDLAERFGWNSNIGLNIGYKTESNWIFSGNTQFFFGNQLRDTSMLRNMYTSDGQIINQNGTYANIVGYERGWIFTGAAGKLFPVIGPNENSGILLTLGGGFMMHKARIDSEQNLVPQFTGDYRKLYDRYTTGFAFNSFLGYLHMSNNGLANFFCGIDVSTGFTQGRRARQVGQTTEEIAANRTDIIAGLRFGWIVPIRKRAPQEFYFD